MSYLGTDIASIHMINMCDLHFVPGGQIYALSKMPSIYMEIVLPQNLHWGPACRIFLNWFGFVEKTTYIYHGEAFAP